MIYLIDDNKNNQRLNNYNITFVEDGYFDGYLTSIEKIEQGDNLTDTSHLNFLNSADCILLHITTEDYDKSKGVFLPGSINNVIKIKEIISQEGERVPLVLFSNSMGEPEYDFENNLYYISSINKNLFYEHLFDFIDHYKNTGEIDLRILASGKNFISKTVTKLTLDILTTLELKRNSDKLELSDLSSSLKSFKLLIELSFPQYDINEILNDLEDNPIRAEEFKRKINQITESYAKYGRSIHSW